jgi:hypothetical protein
MRWSPFYVTMGGFWKAPTTSYTGNYSLENKETISQMFTDIRLNRDLLVLAEDLQIWQPNSTLMQTHPGH